MSISKYVRWSLQLSLIASSSVCLISPSARAVDTTPITLDKADTPPTADSPPPLPPSAAAATEPQKAPDPVAPPPATVPAPVATAAPAPVVAQPAPPPASETVNVPEPPAPIAEEAPVPPAPVAEAQEAHEQPVAAAPDQTRATLRGGRAYDFQNERPSWATQISMSPTALGGADLSGGQKVSPDGITFNFEYQPKFLQLLGVFSVGPSFALYPVFPANGSVENTPYGVWSYGMQARYQARFFHEQLIVPMVGFDYEHINYNLTAIGSGSFTASGPMLGVYILMNTFEPSAAYDFFKDSGILRTYLTAEVRSISGTGTSLQVSGSSYYVGVRVEF